MLKGIDPVISPELLFVLAAMGHGDEIVIVDANFPATSVAAETVHGSPIRIDCGAVRAVEAVLSLLPLDGYEPGPVVTMQVVDEPETVPEVVAEAEPLFTAEGVASVSLERFAFYDRAKTCFAVLQTNELRAYGNFVLRKGVIFG